MILTAIILCVGIGIVGALFVLDEPDPPEDDGAMAPALETAEPLNKIENREPIPVEQDRKDKVDTLAIEHGVPLKSDSSSSQSTVTEQAPSAHPGEQNRKRTAQSAVPSTGGAGNKKRKPKATTDSNTVKREPDSQESVKGRYGTKVITDF